LPVYKSRAVVEVARGVKAFLELNAGLVRGMVPETEREQKQIRRGLKRARKRLSNRRHQLEQLQKLLADKDRQLQWLREKHPETDTQTSKIKPENVVWIFGFGRSGSTWLSSMMADIKDHILWHEPLIGMLFGNLYYNVSYYGIDVSEVLHKNPSFILGSREEIWLKLIRSFFLDGAGAMFPTLGDSTLVVKEPNGSVGAPLLMKALPESRMVLLIRDPRDALASALDAYGKGSWASRVLGKDISGITVETWLDWYLQSMNNARRAYEDHEGPKVLMRYEDLRADTLGEMQRLYRELEMAVDEEELERTVKKHSWEAIPEDKKGSGKFYRKASPCSWNEDLSPEQVEIVERITAPLLKEFYPSV
jgi:hypothetical protein